MLCNFSHVLNDALYPFTFDSDTFGKCTSDHFSNTSANPIGQATLQLAKSIVNKVDNDLIDAIYAKMTASKDKCITADEKANYVNYDGIVDAVTKFEDEEDGIEKVMFIHPKQEKALLTDADFISADKFEAGVAVNGSIGKIAGCWIKKSKKVKQEETTNCWLNPIIKLEPDSAETEYTEDELPALTIFLKKDTQVDHEWFPKKQKHDITASKYYGVAVTNGISCFPAWFFKTLHESKILMISVGGNTTALIQVKDEGKKNIIGEKEHVWMDVTSLKGWLDLSNGQNDISEYSAKMQSSTHIFICDFKSFRNLSKKWVWNPFNLKTGVIQSEQDETKIDATSENARMIIDGVEYHILMIDDPMGMHQHLEIVLQYVGGGLGV